MGEGYLLDADRERGMSEQYAGAALGRSTESTTERALESFSKNVKEKDQSMMDMLSQVNKSLVRLSQTADSQTDELHKTLAKSSKETSDSFGRALTEGAAVTSEDISQMQDGLTKVLQDVSKLGPEVALTSEMNEGIKEMRKDASSFAARMVAAFEAVQQNTQKTSETIAEVAESGAATPAEEAKSEKAEGGIYQSEAFSDSLVDALKYPVGILLDMFQTMGDVYKGVKFGFEKLASGYTELKEGLIDAYDKSVGRIVTGIEDGIKGIFNVFFKDTAMALGFLVGAGVALKDELIAGFDWFRNNWQEALSTIGAKIGEIWSQFTSYFTSDIAPAVGTAFNEVILWLWDRMPAIKEWLADAMIDLYHGILDLPGQIAAAAEAAEEARENKRAAAAGMSRAVKETLAAGGAGAEAFTSATSAGIAPQQALQFVGMAEAAKSKNKGPEAVQEAIAAYKSVLDSGGNEVDARKAAKKAYQSSATEASVPSIVDREKKAQRRAASPQPAESGLKEAAAAMQGAAKEMRANGQRPQRSESPGLDTTGGADDIGIVLVNTGGMSGGFRSAT